MRREEKNAQTMRKFLRRYHRRRGEIGNEHRFSVVDWGEETIRYERLLVTIPSLGSAKAKTIAGFLSQSATEKTTGYEKLLVTISWDALSYQERGGPADWKEQDLKKSLLRFAAPPLNDGEKSSGEKKLNKP